MATCDPNTLLNDGKCFACLNGYQLRLIEAQLLCELLAVISGGGGGGGGSTDLSEGHGEPVNPPTVTSDDAIYFDLDTGVYWWWSVEDQAWL